MEVSKIVCFILASVSYKVVSEVNGFLYIRYPSDIWCFRNT